MKNVVLAVVAMAVGGVGCATMQAHSANDSCADDLVKRGYYEGNANTAHRAAGLDCAKFTPETIKNATELMDAHYGSSNMNLSIMLKKVNNRTPESIACAKQKWDATPANERTEFQVDNECTQVAMAPVAAATPVIANNVFDVLTNAGTATTYLRLVEAAGYTDTLKSKEGITVFAMSDAAFAKEKPDYADWIATNNAENLKRFVSGSVAIGLYPSADIKPAKDKNNDNPSKATSIEGRYHLLVLRKKIVTVDKRPVAGNKEVTAGNGLVYIVDGDLSR